jgi:hypothetical protein
MPTQKAASDVVLVQVADGSFHVPDTLLKPLPVSV